MNDEITRRSFLKLALSGTALLVIPMGCGDETREGTTADALWDQASRNKADGRFFDDHQYQTVRSLTGLLIPEDQDPGAVTAGVVDYIDFLLGAFTVDPPRIFSAGPYSGRHGGQGNFDVYLPLSRVKEIAWRTCIEGSRGIPEREFNGPVKGLQAIYADGVQELDTLAIQQFGAAFVDLTPDRQQSVKSKASKEFIDIVAGHVIEGMYAAPEYGGNQGMVGWKYIRYEGDRQPVGYNRKQLEDPGQDVRLTEHEMEEAWHLICSIFSKYEDQVM